LSFRYTAHGRIARHLGDGLHIHGNQENRRSHVCSSSSSFTPGMTGTYYNNIVFFKHVAAKLMGLGGSFVSRETFHFERRRFHVPRET
jgi:hypothetical protein